MEKRTITGRTKKRAATAAEGVTVEPLPATVGETVTIDYNGLLAQSGADKVYVHIGYGPNHHWSGIRDIPMDSQKNTWTCSLTPADTRLNFCFHDSAHNWDNNNGHNWSFALHNGEQI